jgi:hypothetical protein
MTTGKNEIHAIRKDLISEKKRNKQIEKTNFLLSQNLLREEISV